MKAALPGAVKRRASARPAPPRALTPAAASSIRGTPRDAWVAPFFPSVTASEIFAGLAPAEAHEFFESLHEANKSTYKGAVQLTASRRKLRPVFLERKPRVERHAWMQGVLAQPANEELGLEILQNWLLGVHRPLLADFLEACGFEHENGLVENIPPQPARETVDAAVDAIAAKHPPLAVKIYLNLFQPFGAEAWPDLDALLVIDPRLALNRPA